MSAVIAAMRESSFGTGRLLFGLRNFATYAFPPIIYSRAARAGNPIIRLLPARIEKTIGATIAEIPA